MMGSLMEIYQQIESADDELEKQAELEAVEDILGDHAEQTDEDTMKIAAEYDAAGRIMARSFFDEMLKSAQEEEEEEGEEDEKKKKEEDEKKKKKGLPPALASAMAEKKASIVARMQEDPEYAQELIARYTETE